MLAVLGVHWIADALGCRPESLTAEAVRAALRELPDALELTRVAEPEVFEHLGSDGEMSSVAGIVLIAESHVSLHCFPAQRALHADVFSCKEMDLQVARRYVREHFGARALEEQVLDRGRVDPLVTGTRAARREGAAAPRKARIRRAR